jgi:hypothetical protein
VSIATYDEIYNEAIMYYTMMQYINYKWLNGSIDLCKIIDYIQIICYNFFIIQSFLNFFLFFFNFFMYYSDKLYICLNIDLIKDVIFNPKNNNINLFYLPVYRANDIDGGFFNTNEFL